jgi:hypothetical protein
MWSVRQALRRAAGACAVVTLLLGSVKGAGPGEKSPPSGSSSTSNDLKLAKPRSAEQLADTTVGELVDKFERQNRLNEGFLRAEVRNALKRAKAMTGTDAIQADEALKLLLDKVRGTTELSADVRAQLVEQIEAAQRTAHRQAQAQAERQLRAEQVVAESEARERINRELSLQEQKVEQLMSRYDALVDEERYRDAEALAGIADEIKPGQPGLRGAELTARMAGYTADINAVRDLRHKGFVDTTYQVEQSHIPTADEPPIVYVAPEVWQSLTERRRKYRAVDLTQHGPSETKILAALDEKTELDFAEQPLTEVMDYLKQRHGIEIQLDVKALSDAGVGSDVPITRSIKGITLRSALKLLLGELDLTYVIRNEVLMITSQDEAEHLLSTRVYPVADLVVPIAQPRGGGMGGMGGGMGGMGGGMGGMTGGMGGMGMGGMGMGGMGGAMGGGGMF